MFAEGLDVRKNQFREPWCDVSRERVLENKPRGIFLEILRLQSNCNIIERKPPYVCLFTFSHKLRNIIINRKRVRVNPIWNLINPKPALLHSMQHNN